MARSRSPAAVCLVAGFLFGLPALRLEGLYLALATLRARAVGAADPQVTSSTGPAASQGIVLTKPEAPAFPAGLPLNPDQWLYFFTLAVLLLLFWLAVNLLRGRVGRALISIRDNHIAAAGDGHQHLRSTSR